MKKRNLLSLVLVMSLISCGQHDSSSKDDNKKPPQTSTQPADGPTTPATNPGEKPLVNTVNVEQLYGSWVVYSEPFATEKEAQSARDFEDAVGNTAYAKSLLVLEITDQDLGFYLESFQHNEDADKDGKVLVVSNIEVRTFDFELTSDHIVMGQDFDAPGCIYVPSTTELSRCKTFKLPKGRSALSLVEKDRLKLVIEDQEYFLTRL